MPLARCSVDSGRARPELEKRSDLTLNSSLWSYATPAMRGFTSMLAGNSDLMSALQGYVSLNTLLRSPRLVLGKFPVVSHFYARREGVTERMVSVLHESKAKELPSR
jgi:hypothetical protein